MAIDIKTLGALLKSNLELVKTIRSGGLAIGKGADAVDAARQEIAQKIQLGANGKLDVSFSNEADQKALAARIVELQAAIENSADDPVEAAALRVDLANAFLTLANQPNGTVASIVQFSAVERAEIAGFLQQAKLDVAQRKLQASVLEAALSLTRAALKVAAVVAV